MSGKPDIGENRASFYFQLFHFEGAMEKRKFGNKLKLPSIVQIKHQILLKWLKDQKAVEAAEAGAHRG
jgi:hypothetical protein